MWRAWVGVGNVVTLLAPSDGPHPLTCRPWLCVMLLLPLLQLCQDQEVSPDQGSPCYSALASPVGRLYILTGRLQPLVQAWPTQCPCQLPLF